jgi:cyclophilin family peptidyl-prolyl cis-trans isomerase
VKRRLFLISALIAVGGGAMAQEPQEASKPAPKASAKAGKWAGPEVTLYTTKGDIVITLDMVGAPKTAQQFLAVVKSGHYSNAAFYRIEPGFLIQAGDYDPAGRRRKAQRPNVPLETATNKHARGAVALAHGDDPNSGTSTFYIDLAANEQLNAEAGAPPNTTGFAVFGHVTSGMKVVDAISRAKLNPAAGIFIGKEPFDPIVITKAAVTKE